MFEHIAVVDWPLLFMNTLMLGFVAFLPLPTKVLASALHAHHGEPAAMFFYGMPFALSGVAVVGTWRSARRRGHLTPSISDAQARAIEHRYLVGPSLYAVSALIGLIAPVVALVLYAFLVVFFWYPGRALGSLSKTATSRRATRSGPRPSPRTISTPPPPDRRTTPTAAHPPKLVAVNVGS